MHFIINLFIILFHPNLKPAQLKYKIAYESFHNLKRYDIGPLPSYLFIISVGLRKATRKTFIKQVVRPTSDHQAVT